MTAISPAGELESPNRVAIDRPRHRASLRREGTRHGQGDFDVHASGTRPSVAHARPSPRASATDDLADRRAGSSTISPRPFRLRLLAAVLVSAGLFACSKGIPEPGKKELERAALAWPGITTEQLQQGRQLYVGRCSGCHMPYPAQSRDSQAWRRAVEAMRERAGLTDSQGVLVWRYLSVAGRGMDTAAGSVSP